MNCILFLANQRLSIPNVLICFEKEIIERVEVYAEDRVEDGRFCRRIGDECKVV